MNPAPELIDALYMDKVRRARQMAPADKLLAGAQLYEYTRAIVTAGIRHQHPSATESEIRDLFRQRLRLARQLEKTS